MEFQLADLYEGLCDADPDAAVLIVGERTVSRAQLDRRANRLAHHLLDRGVGRGDHVGVYAFNRIEWVEALLACWKIGAATININFRYVRSELTYLWENSDMAALIYERQFSDHVAALAPDFPGLHGYLILEDGSAGPEEPLGIPYEAALADASEAREFAPRSPDDLYIVYTGGTTGLPKGTLWRHADLYSNVAGRLGKSIDRPEDITLLTANPLGLRMLTLSPLMHGGGQWPLFICVFNGGVALFPTSAHFDPHEILGIIARHEVSTLSIIGDAMGRPIAETCLGPGPSYDTDSLKVVSTGGALLTAPVRALLRKAFPGVYISGGIGSSEIGTAARETSSFDSATGPRFALARRVAVLDDNLRPVEPGSGGVGLIARRGDIPLGYYKDPEKTAATFRHDPDGVRWVLPGDWARVEDDGTITLLGRGSQCINSGGEKIFPDEIEAVLAQHPRVRHAAVVGVPDPTWMERVVALVEALDPASPPSLDEIRAHCRPLLAGYKLPRDLVVGELRRTATGKVDYVWARDHAITATGRRD
jgi:acyl-CoA synthetase (AMP-forming)/AMP-acid ligase II